jgi:hypothetical protein
MPDPATGIQELKEACEPVREVIRRLDNEVFMGSLASCIATSLKSTTELAVYRNDMTREERNKAAHDAIMVKLGACAYAIMCLEHVIQNRTENN